MGNPIKVKVAGLTMFYKYPHIVRAVIVRGTMYGGTASPSFSEVVLPARSSKQQSGQSLLAELLVQVQPCRLRFKGIMKPKLLGT